MTIYDVDIDSPTGGPAGPDRFLGSITPVDAASTCEAASAATLLPR
jgi:hypothetical protein